MKAGCFMRILLTVSYDGSEYYGWQRQKGFVTVQQRLEEGLSQMLKQNITVRGASRTDTGVHAIGQRAVFAAETSIPVDKIPLALNSFLPEDIVVTAAKIVDEEFHPQYSVTDKTYCYKILNDSFRVPMLNKYTDFVRDSLDIAAMNRACEYLVGTHDFNAFCASGSTAKTTVRTIFSMRVEKVDNIVSIWVRGNGFLYNMIRIIAGTLVNVGRGKYPPEYVQEIIKSLDRTKAGKTMSPGGLTLMEVNYGD